MSSARPQSWHHALHELTTHGVAHVLATQVTSAGSTPREPGAKMVITANEVFDTLGGGTFEWQTIAAARDHLQQGQPGIHLESFSLGGRSGQCCGGAVNVMLEVFPGATCQLAIFGAGHVGREIMALTTPLGWQRHWLDSRDIFSAEDHKLPRLTCKTLSCTASSVAALPPNTHALVMTHSHDEDYALVAELIERDDVASVGLIGSASKWQSFQRRLERDGHSAAAIARVRSPIGCLAGGKLHNKTPYAIALTAVTELLWLTDTPTPETTRGLAPATLRALFSQSTTA